MSTDVRGSAVTQVSPNVAGGALRCTELSVDYSGSRVLRSIDLEVAEGELVALLGASGSGKTTLLHAVAGLVAPTSGEIWLGDRCVANNRQVTPPEQREIGLVFQNFALWPHLTVIDTVAYPLRRSGRSRRAARNEAGALLERLGVAHLADRRPAELSGGEQQRVGLGRALARDARLYLLDEPTAHLDTHLRNAFQESVLDRRAETGAATVYSTHDAAEALALADRVALLAHGEVIQVGTPDDVYAKPESAHAAELTGPGSLLVAAVARSDDGHLQVDFGGGAITVPGHAQGAHLLVAHRGAAVLVRPDWLTEGGPTAGRVTAAAFAGPYTDYHLDTAGQRLLIRLAGRPRYPIGSMLPFTLNQVWVFDTPHPSATMAPG